LDVSWCWSRKRVEGQLREIEEKAGKKKEEVSGSLPSLPLCSWLRPQIISLQQEFQAMQGPAAAGPGRGVKA